jgi:SAM-dependent methyltransferase
MKSLLDIDELMTRIREEAQRRDRVGISAEVTSGLEHFPLPPPLDLPGQPVIHRFKTEDDKTAEKFLGLLRRAFGKTKVSSRVPKLFRRFFRKQGGFNEAVLDGLQLLMKSQLRLLSQSQHVVGYLEAQGHWLRALNEARALERSWLCAIPPLINVINDNVSRVQETIQDLRADLDTFQQDAAETKGEVIALVRESIAQSEKAIMASQGAVQAQHEERANHLTEQLTAGLDQVKSEAISLRETLDRLHEHVTRLEAQHELESLKASAASNEARLSELAAEMASLRKDLAEVTSSFQEVRDLNESRWHKSAEVEAESIGEAQSAIKERFSVLGGSIESIRADAERLEQRQIADASFLKSQASLQQRLIEAVAAETNQRGGGPKKAGGKKGASLLPVTNHTHDAFYLAFEDRFRGARSEIKKRMRVYLPFLKRQRVTKQGRILDVGCGRGEWLEILSEAGYAKAEGVDLNASMVEQCRERKLPVSLADGISHLALLPKATMAAITAFHVIEHLSFDQLMRFIGESHRVLKPGGLTILETPNLCNILVGASDFYRDMTHRNPIHPDTISFALESVGFREVVCYFLAESKGGRKAIPQRDFRFDDLAAYTTVPRDFAVVARKS